MTNAVTWFADKSGQGRAMTVYRTLVPAVGGSLPARIRRQDAPGGAKGWNLTIGDSWVGRYKTLKDAKEAASATMWDLHGVGNE